MKRTLSFLAAAVLVLCLTATAWAHFGMIIPGKPTLAQGDKSVDLTLCFAHPMELQGMNMAKPKSFAVYVDGNPRICWARSARPR